MRLFEFAGQTIHEAFDSSVPYTVTSATNDTFTTAADIGGRRVEFGGVTWESPGKWEVAFESKDAKGRSLFGKTGQGSELKVFSFVIASMTEMVARYRPLEIVFTSSKEDGNRSELYARLLRRFPIEGYNLVSIRPKGSEDEFVIRRADQE